jgi:arylsulfatase A-like enzyme
MTLFESATRVPLIIRAPHLTASAGQRTDSPAQLLDLYPTLASLAGLPRPASGLDGVDLAQLFTHPELTTVSAGAYSQQARCYQKNTATPHPTALQASLTRMMTCEFVPRDQMDFMGYSVRTREWRFTEWVVWNKTAMGPIWTRSVGRELYDHRVSTPIAL